MKATEIKARIDKLEYDRFILSMKDRWNLKDYDEDRKMSDEIMKLTKQLETV